MKKNTNKSSWLWLFIIAGTVCLAGNISNILAQESPTQPYSSICHTGTTGPTNELVCTYMWNTGEGGGEVWSAQVTNYVQNYSSDGNWNTWGCATNGSYVYCFPIQYQATGCQWVSHTYECFANPYENDSPDEVVTTNYTGLYQNVQYGP